MDQVRKGKGPEAAPLSQYGEIMMNLPKFLIRHEPWGLVSTPPAEFQTKG